MDSAHAARSNSKRESETSEERTVDGGWRRVEMARTCHTSRRSEAALFSSVKVPALASSSQSQQSASFVANKYAGKSDRHRSVISGHIHWSEPRNRGAFGRWNQRAQ